MQHWMWLYDELAKHANRDTPFWQAMSLVVYQVEGMLQGYNTRAATREGQQLGLRHISLQEWLALNTMGVCHTRVRLAVWTPGPRAAACVAGCAQF